MLEATALSGLYKAPEDGKIYIKYDSWNFRNRNGWNDVLLEVIFNKHINHHSQGRVTIEDSA